jgi:putative glycosyltransferase (TIGR04348 family)
MLVTPALADANNGNWQTAQRWARLLAGDYEVRLAKSWRGGDEAVLVALHARRSAPSIAAWRTAHPARPLVVVLTGTDLYRDIAVDASAQHSLALADRLVVLNELGADALPAALHPRVRVCLQSTPARRTLPKTARHLRALMVGHLRAEKSPRTLFEAVRRLHAAGRRDLLIDHIGAPLDAALGAEAQALARDCPAYRWLGALGHEATRRRIQATHVLVHPSVMEGGAHVVIEAVTSGTPVIASQIDGNLGLLGRDYTGVFPAGDAAALASLLTRARDEPAMLIALQAQCAQRAPLFRPGQERASLLALLGELLAPGVA